RLFSGPRPRLSTSCSQNGRSFQQLKAVIEFDGLVEVINDAEFVFQTSAIAIADRGPYPLGGRCLACCGRAFRGGPLAEDRERRAPALRVGRRSQRRLRRLDGETVPQAGHYRPADLFGVHRRPQERALARYLLRPRHEAQWSEI